MKARCKLKGGKRVVVGTLNSSTIARCSSSFPPLGMSCHLRGWFTLNFWLFFIFMNKCRYLVTYRWWNVTPLVNMEDFEFLSWSLCKNYKNGGYVIWKFIPTLSLLIMHASYFYVIWLSHIFNRYGDCHLLCSFWLQPKVNMHFQVGILIIWMTRWKPFCICSIMVSVVNGKTWDKLIRDEIAALDHYCRSRSKTKTYSQHLITPQR